MLPQVIEGTENLFLVGLPKDALDFVWYEHRKEAGSHAHCALTLSLLPVGGAFEYEQPRRLLQYFDRLAGLALGLSDPLEPKRARLVCAARYSNRKENKPDIERICRATADWWDNRSIEHNHEGFIDLVGTTLGYSILCAPDCNGEGCLTEKGEKGKEELGLKAYRCTVIVQSSSGAGAIIVLKGPVCRPGFSDGEWMAELKRRKEACDYMRDHRCHSEPPQVQQCR